MPLSPRPRPHPIPPLPTRVPRPRARLIYLNLSTEQFIFLWFSQILVNSRYNIGGISDEKIGQLISCGRRQWSSGPEAMENNASNSHSLEAQQSSGPATISESHKLPAENVNDCLFVNQGVIAWHSIRKEWVGEQSKRTRKAPREPVISWCTTYDDLLSTSQPFSQPIPLSEMVDFLVDTWHEEGLYD